MDLIVPALEYNPTFTVTTGNHPVWQSEQIFNMMGIGYTYSNADNLLEFPSVRVKL